MKLRIAFMGYDEAQTCTYFRELAERNSEQIGFCNLAQGRIVLLDGSEILRVSPGIRFISARFDQIIIADDHRRHCEIKNHTALAIISQRLAFSPVPPEFQWQIYDLDAEDLTSV